MENESNSNANQPKPKRAYHRREPQQVPQQQIAPSPHIAELEAGLVPLVNQRLEANQRVRIAAQKANQANSELQNVQNELAQIESEINYRMNLIGQLKNGGMPVPATPYIAQNLQQSGAYSAPSFQDPRYAPAPPSSPYNPVVPFPTMPPATGVGSFPARNDGLYPDAAPRGYVERDPEKLVNTEREYEFPPDVVTKINEGR